MALNSVIGALRVNLGLNSAAFMKGLSASDKELKAFQQRVNRIGRNFQSLGVKFSAGLTLPLTGLAAKSLDAAKKQEAAVAQVEAALRSMGDTAGFTSEQLQKIASGLQGNSLFGDEEILDKVTANLLTFGNVAGEQFTRAQQLALDLSARLDQDLKSSAIQLGKALNDPVEGLSALSRVGIQFTEEQENLIKSLAETGEVAQAQTLILDELERQYAGQAQAVAELDSGKIAQSYNRIGDALEDVGKVILPVVADILESVADLADRFSNLSEPTQRFIVIAGGLAAAIGPVAISVGLAVTAFSALLPVIIAIASPVGIAVAAIAALAAGAVILYQNWDDAVAKVKEIAGTLGKLAKDAVDSFIDGLKSIIKRAGKVFDDLKKELKRKVKDLGRDMLQAGKDVAAGLGDGIKDGASRAVDKAKDMASSVAGAVTGFFETQSPSKLFKRIGGDLTDGLAIGIEDGTPTAVSAAERLGERVGSAVAEAAQRELSPLAESLGDLVSGGGINTVLDNLGARASSSLTDLITSGFDSGGFSGILNNITGAVSGLGSAISGVISGGFSGILNNITGAVSGLGSAISGVISGGLSGLSGLFSAAIPVAGIIGGVVSLAKGLIGGTSVIGQGIKIGVEDGQVTGGQFTRKRTKRLFGLIDRRRTNTTPFQQEFLEGLQEQTDAVRDSVRGVFEIFGAEVSDAAINGVDLAIRRIDTRGLNEEQLQERLAQVFVDYAESISQSLGGISFEAALNLAAVSEVLNSAGQMFFGSVSNMSAAAEALVAQAGGFDALSQSVGFFVDRFFTETEKLDLLSDRVSEAFANLSLEVPSTLDAFKDLVLSQNLMTESGRETYAALLQIAPQFEAVTTAAANFTDAVSNFGAFQLTQKNFENEIDEKIAQVALARGLGLSDVEQIVSGSRAGGSDSTIGLLQTMAEILDRMEVLGIPERT